VTLRQANFSVKTAWSLKHLARYMEHMKSTFDVSIDNTYSSFIPNNLKNIENDQTTIPRLAKRSEIITQIEMILPKLPTVHRFYRKNSTALTTLKPESVHLIVTSPPYWTLKKYNERDGQLGHIAHYEAFLAELNKVWKKCYKALVPGGRLICIVGDVCLSRRRNQGRHTVVPLHASIQEQCRKIGFDNLSPIIWHKISNANFEAERGSTFLGKPYEPNAVIKNDIEFILMERKSGGYRSPSFTRRILSVISEENHKLWFNQIWTGLTGASTRNHPAPFPIELATRLIRMFSFIGDTVLDPFLGSGTTSIAAYLSGRNSIGVEIDEHYLDKALLRFNEIASTLDTNHRIEINR
jgi:modification methylase